MCCSGFKIINELYYMSGVSADAVVAYRRKLARARSQTLVVQVRIIDPLIFGFYFLFN